MNNYTLDRPPPPLNMEKIDEGSSLCWNFQKHNKFRNEQDPNVMKRLSDYDVTTQVGLEMEEGRKHTRNLQSREIFRGTYGRHTTSLPNSKNWIKSKFQTPRPCKNIKES